MYRPIAWTPADADIPATIARDTEITAAVAAHESAGDPHAGYLKESVVSGFATPALVLGTAAAAGAATTGVRSDATILAFDATSPAASAVGDSAAVGAAAVAARRDHRHAREAFATPAIVLGSAAAAGNTTTPIRSNATIAAFDATSPAASAPGDAAAVGTAAFAARRDHKHAREAFATPAVLLSNAAAAGSAATLMRSDATIAAFDATAPSTQAFGDAAAVGAANFAARRDHKHAMPANPAADSGWIAASYLNSWVSYDTTSYPLAQYRKIGSVVYLRGLCKSGTMGAAIFVLPAGYRPSKHLQMPAASQNIQASLQGSYVEIMSTGDVRPATGNNTWFSLDGVIFLAD